MTQSRFSAFAATAGRLHTNTPTPYATISPLAAPGAFASKHRLHIKYIARWADHGGDIAVVVLFTNRRNQGVVVSGTVSDEHDDHGATIIDDLDFLPLEEAYEELHIALDVVLGERAPHYRRQLLRAVA